MGIFYTCVKITFVELKQEIFNLKKYWIEILSILLIKIVLLTSIWYMCFRTPPKLDDKTVGEHILY